MAKIYIAGKITGNPNYKEEFGVWEKRLADEGFTVVSPVYHDKYEGDYSDVDAVWNHYMRISIAKLTECDEIFMLPGWQRSKGANVERMIAGWLSLPIHYGVINGLEPRQTSTQD